jgi:hypothetical protein
LSILKFNMLLFDLFILAFRSKIALIIFIKQFNHHLIVFNSKSRLSFLLSVCPDSYRDVEDGLTPYDSFENLVITSFLKS